MIWLIPFSIGLGLGWSLALFVISRRDQEAEAAQVELRNIAWKQGYGTGLGEKIVLELRSMSLSAPRPKTEMKQ